MSEIRRVGVLTGGGDCPGLNAVIRAVVKSGIHDHGWEMLGIKDGFEGFLLPHHTLPLDIDRVRGILPAGGTILGSTNRVNPFAYRASADGNEEPQDVSGQVISRIDELKLDALVVIGGDGTMHLANRFSLMGVPVVGIPKTIDNDAVGTDITVGFDSALDIVTQAIDRLHTTAESHHRVMVIEVMGRNAGWIALSAGLAGGADVILIPEIPYRVDAICRKVIRRNELGRKFSILVVSEGALPRDGQKVYQALYDPSAPRRLGGIGQQVSEDIYPCIKKEVRVTVLGHMQRGGSPSSFDRILGTRFGVEVVRLLAGGRSGLMVGLHRDAMGSVPLSEAQGQRLVDPEGELVGTARSLSISLGC
jgi:6-phosphofructokinase 1